MNLREFLSKPHPNEFNKESILIPGGVVFLVLFLIAPGGFATLPIPKLFFYSLLFGVVTSSTAFLVVIVLIKLFPKAMSDDDWTMGKELALLVFIVSMIACTNFAVVFAIGLSSGSAVEAFLKVLGNTLAISIFPLSFSVLWEQFRHQKKQLQKVASLTEKAHLNTFKNDPKTNHESLIVFVGENEKPELQLVPNQISYMKSDGNYVDVIYTDEKEMSQKKLIRNRLKTLFEMLPEDRFFHAHKSFVINMNRVTELRGNARNLEVRMSPTNEWLPISRSKSEEFSQRLTSRKAE